MAAVRNRPYAIGIGGAAIGVTAKGNPKALTLHARSAQHLLAGLVPFHLDATAIVAKVQPIREGDG
ncbi:MAG: hypothetical protein IT355_15240 [Gemmatimonadaceae bacterium]|nr:hypothetical protein [Gemmatimonadaceae bacterium]